MQRRILVLLLMVITQVGFAQAVISGVVSNEQGTPIGSADVYIENTDYYYLTSGDGIYQLDLPAGQYTIKCHAFGFNDEEFTIDLKEGDNISKDIILLIPENGNANVNLDQITVFSKVDNESESATINMQKKAAEVKEIIGAEQLSKLGVSDMSGAVEKVSGISVTKGTSDVYVRGLGDRYLNTSLNGMSIPSNRIDRKNISLDLFPSDVVENIAISKAYRPSFYANFGSGNIDISSKRHAGANFIDIGLKTGINTNVLKNDVFGNFKVSPNQNTFGFKSTKNNVEELRTTSWSPEDYNMPIDREISLSAGRGFQLFGNTTKMLFTGNYGVSHKYRTGEFSSYRANRLRRYYTDTEEYKVETLTQAMLVFDMNLPGRKSNIKTTHLFINQADDAVFEGGRNGEGYVFDNQPKETSNFMRDQRYKQNLIFINQINGNHANVFKEVDLSWGLGYNYLNAKQPNTIFNEMVIYDHYAQFTQNTNFQSSRGFQDLVDNQVTGYADFTIPVSKEDASTEIELNIGANASFKKRSFESQYIGLSNLQSQTVSSVDDIDSYLNIGNYDNGSIGVISSLSDLYDADVTIYGAFAELSIKTDQLDVIVGGRFEGNQQNLDWDVNNYIDPVTFLPRLGEVDKNKTGFYPALNIKYEINKAHYLRLAASKTLSVPELRELSPFEYVDAQRRTFRGNPDLVFPDVYSVDLKWEMYPHIGTLFSIGAFGKQIENPINIVQNVSSAGFFRPENTGDKANVYGIEAEAKFKAHEFSNADLNIGFNATRMWTKQDLYDFSDRDGDGKIDNGYQFNNKTSSKLQGAAEYLINLSVSYETNGDLPTTATLSANYTSDKIYSLGSPNSAINTDQLYNFNDDIIQKGVMNLDFILSQKISEKAGLKLSVKNILNPKLKLVQDHNITNFIDVAPSTLEVGKATLESYTDGVQVSLGFKYEL